jgi:hypothetical protein
MNIFHKVTVGYVCLCKRMRMCARVSACIYYLNYLNNLRNKMPAAV